MTLPLPMVMVEDGCLRRYENGSEPKPVLKSLFASLMMSEKWEWLSAKFCSDTESPAHDLIVTVPPMMETLESISIEELVGKSRTICTIGEAVLLYCTLLAVRLIAPSPSGVLPVASSWAPDCSTIIGLLSEMLPAAPDEELEEMTTPESIVIWSGSDTEKFPLASK
jgi:hypothetical protein